MVFIKAGMFCSTRNFPRFPPPIWEIKDFMNVEKVSFHNSYKDLRQIGMKILFKAFHFSVLLSLSWLWASVYWMRNWSTYYKPLLVCFPLRRLLFIFLLIHKYRQSGVKRRGRAASYKKPSGFFLPRRKVINKVYSFLSLLSFSLALSFALIMIS